MKRPLVIGLLIAALLFVLAGIGAVAYFAIRRADFAIFNVPLVSAKSEETKILKVDVKKPVTLTVNDGAGSVSVVGGDVKAVEVRIVKTGYAPTQAGAEEHLRNIKIDVKQDGNAITLTYKLSGSQTHQVDTVDFIVTVPTETAVQIEDGFGAVNVSAVQGDVSIANDFGDVTVENIEGALFVDNSSGEVRIGGVEAGSKNVELYSGFGSITLGKVNAADITIKSNSGSIDIEVARAKGAFSVNSDFGDITCKDSSAASLTIESKSGKVTVAQVNIRGALIVSNDFGEIVLNQAMADSYDLDSNSGGIEIDGAKNNIKAHTDFGSIVIKNAQDASLDLSSNSGGITFNGSLGRGPHTVKTDFGEIELTLPAGVKLNVDLETDLGGISSDIPLTVTLDGSTDKNHQVGTMNGGGDLLTVQTNSGGISIHAAQ